METEKKIINMRYIYQISLIVFGVLLDIDGRETQKFVVWVVMLLTETENIVECASFEVGGLGKSGPVVNTKLHIVILRTHR